MLASGIGVTHQMAVTTLGESPFSNQLSHWIVADRASNLLTNIYSTGLIVYRIHLVNSNPDIVRLHGQQDLKSIIAVLVESSALLSAWIAFGMVTYATKSPLDSFVRSTLGTMSGISFTLINVRVALGWDQTNREFAPGSSIILASPATATACSSLIVHLNTQVDRHVDMPRKSGAENVDTQVDMHVDLPKEGPGVGVTA
ncbi:hypothetical protein K438DRAFT_774623 [Mycena galopus ATCC 62051]|nr:hypothetical protein K438DRAFT_774623 [Mycena galopus ATCC 62051]